MKTRNDILTDIFKIISASPIKTAINGGIYKVTRPTDSKLEDCIFHLINGVNDKFLQYSALYVKIFYNDLLINNTYSEDLSKGSTFERLLFDLSVILLHTNGYSFDIQTRETYTEAVIETRQHYALLKINFLLTI
jgi:hypothetical protein